MQQRQFYPIVALGDAYAPAEVPDGGRGVAALAQTGQGWQARVVPAVDMPFADQPCQLALAHHGVLQGQPREFNLLGVAIQGQFIQHPVIEGAMILKAQVAK